MKGKRGSREDHRYKLLRKLGAKRSADLVRVVKPLRKLNLFACSARLDLPQCREARSSLILSPHRSGRGATAPADRSPPCGAGERGKMDQQSVWQSISTAPMIAILNSR